jgi:hypothetical protein
MLSDNLNLLSAYVILNILVLNILFRCRRGGLLGEGLPAKIWLQFLSLSNGYTSFYIGIQVDVNLYYRPEGVRVLKSDLIRVVAFNGNVLIREGLLYLQCDQ